MYEALMTEEMKPWRDLLLVHKFAVEQIKTKLQILDEEFRNIHDYNPIEHIRYRIKNQIILLKSLSDMVLNLLLKMQESTCRILEALGLFVLLQLISIESMNF